MRPELARLVLAMVKPVRLVWPRLDDGLIELELHFIFGGSVADAIEAVLRLRQLSDQLDTHNVLGPTP